MPHRAPKYRVPRRQLKLGVNMTTAPKYKGVSAKEIDNSVKDDDALVIPKSLAGQITHKRYVQMRKMGLQMGDIGALAMMYERDEFPGELLFSGKKKQLMDKKYKKLRIKTRKELNARWIEMRDERVADLKKAKTKLEKKAKKKKVVKKKKRSELNDSEKLKPKRVRKKPTIPTSYTDGDLPAENPSSTGGNR